MEDNTPIWAIFAVIVIKFVGDALLKRKNGNGHSQMLNALALERTLSKLGETMEVQARCLQRLCANVERVEVKVDNLKE